VEENLVENFFATSRPISSLNNDFALHNNLFNNPKISKSWGGTPYSRKKN
jgi:hypothetical protein